MSEQEVRVTKATVVVRCNHVIHSALLAMDVYGASMCGIQSYINTMKWV